MLIILPDKNLKKFKRGQSVLEVVLALAIFSLIASSMVSLVLGGSSALIQGGQQTKAEELAQEGMEALRSVRDGAWNEITMSQVEVSQSSGQWILVDDVGADGEAIGDYTQIIRLENICRDSLDKIASCPGSYTDIHSKKAAVEVGWEVRTGVNNFVQRVAYLTNWDSRDWMQTDWSGGSGQAQWSDAAKYDFNDGNIDNSAAGELKLTCGGIFNPGFESGETCSGAPNTCSSQGEDACSSCGCAWNSGYCFNSGSCSGCGGNPECKACELFGCSWSRGNCLGTLDCSLAGDETNCTNCGQCSWNPGVCNGTPADCSTHTDETSCTNCGCTWSEGVWSYSAWDVGPGEVTPTGDQHTSGGNPASYVDITVPRGNNDEVGGYWEQSFTTYQDNPVSATFDFDYKVINFNSTPDIAKIRVYIDTVSGDPVNQVGDSITISSEDDWTSSGSIDISSAITTVDTYYLKIAFWVETPGGNSGPYTVSLDNANLNLGSAACSASGYLISSAFDMGDASPAQAVEWSETIPSCSPACGITIDVSTAPNSGGSPGTWSSWQNATIPEGTLLPTSLNGNQWVRYRANFTGDGNDTPILNEIKINYK